MTDSIDLTSEDLRKQARDLREFARDLREANTSAANRDLYAYGAIGLTWAWMMNERFSAADQFTGDAAAAADRVANELDAMATDYTNQDSANASALRTAGGDLS